MHYRIKERDDRPRDQIPILGRRDRQYRLKIKVRIPVIRLARAHIEHVIVLLKSDRPKAADRIGQLFVKLSQGFSLCLIVVWSVRRRRFRRPQRGCDKNPQQTDSSQKKFSFYVFPPFLFFELTFGIVLPFIVNDLNKLKSFMCHCERSAAGSEPFSGFEIPDVATTAASAAGPRSKRTSRWGNGKVIPAA